MDGGEPNGNLLPDDSDSSLRGDVRNLLRYKQLFNHVNLSANLPRRISPSDIDMVLDNKRDDRILFGELTMAESWDEKGKGQRELYERLVMTSGAQCFSVLLTHHMEAEEAIDTLYDVDSFHVMYKQEERITYSDVLGGCLWPDFVAEFYREPNFWNAKINELDMADVF